MRSKQELQDENLLTVEFDPGISRLLGRRVIYCAMIISTFIHINIDIRSAHGPVKSDRLFVHVYLNLFAIDHCR